MADWHWACDPPDLLHELPTEAADAVAQLAEEITARDSVVYREGISYTGSGPGLRTEARDQLLLTYLTDIRGERIVIVQVTWFAES